MKDEYRGFQERCRANLQVPLVARHLDYEVTTIRSGQEVLTDAGLTTEEVLADPTLLLRGEAYDGGLTTHVDPFHAATRWLIALRLAAGTQDEDVLEAAVAMAVDAIAEHGVPPEISDVHSVGLRAQDFSAADVVGSLYIPSAEPEAGRLSRVAHRIRRALRTRPMPTFSAGRWLDRAEAGYTMVGARASMPADHPARSLVTGYTEVVLDPGVVDSLVMLRGDHVGAVLWEWAEKAPRYGWGAFTGND